MMQRLANLIFEAQKKCDQLKRDYQLIHQLIFFLSPTIESTTQLVTQLNNSIDFDVQQFWKHLNACLYQNLPLARITGQTNFFNESLIVDSKVFIPRNETELVVQAAIEAHSQKKLATYVDLCCGTGAIGLLVKQNCSQLQLSLVDCCLNAINNAKKNAFKLQIKACFFQTNWLRHLQKHNYDLITANFPYLDIDDVTDKNLVNNEPHNALFALNQGWNHYANLLTWMTTNLVWKVVILEISHHHQKQWLNAMKIYKEWQFKIINDYNNYSRIVCITRHGH